MTYADFPTYDKLIQKIELIAQLKAEHGASGVSSILNEAERALQSAVIALDALPADEELARKEPDELSAIKALRSEGPRRIGERIDEQAYPDKLEGALLGRMAANILGAPVEFWEIVKMEALAEETGLPFPPTDYWTYVPEPASLRYHMSRRDEYTRGKLNGVPVDDDIAYTLLGLLIMEDSGPDLNVDDIGKAWLEYLPYAATAEAIALENLKAGVPPLEAAMKNNACREWIGADIRSDPWGYMAPGWPEKAAEFAYHDAYISHRRQGIYGEMYFSAAIAAAFVVDDPMEALRIGLTEIPAESQLAHAIAWSLEVAPEIRDFRAAREAMEDRFRGMHKVHTINNACLTVWGLSIGGTDFTKVISETVAMGMDNDCTAATAGSIVGAIVGKSGIPERWYKNFNDVVHSYLIGHKEFSITDLLKRFARQAEIVWG